MRNTGLADTAWMVAKGVKLKATNTFIRVPLLAKGIDPAPGWTRSDYLIIGALTAVALALRIPGLDQGMWIDELATLYSFVRLPAVAIINAVGATNNHVLYSLMAHYAVSWLGESAWTLRLPALVFGVAAIPALYHLGRQVAGRKEAFLVALFMTLNYQFVWYSQNARGYTGLLLGAILASILFIRLLAATRPSIGLILAYAVVAALTAWIHLTAVFVFLAHALIWLALASKPNREDRHAAVMPTFMALLLAGSFTLALYAPTFWSENNQFDDVSDGTSGFVAEWEDASSHVLSAATTWVMKEYAQGLQRSIPGGWPVVVLVVLVLLTGIASYLRQGVAVAGLLLLPALITILVIYSRGALFFPRFLFSSTGFLMLVAVRGGFVTAKLCLPFLSRRSLLLIGSCVALASAMLIPAAWKPKQDFTGVAEFIAQHRLPDDALLCMAGARFPLQVFMGIDCDALYFLTGLERIEARHARIWMIYTLPTHFEAQAPQIWKRVQKSGDYVKIRQFDGSLNGGDIIVLLKSPPQPGISPGQESR
jgi:hypothetical protein